MATIAPFQWNEPGATPRPDFVPEEVYDKVAESHPCYGAVLQLSVGPSTADKGNFAPAQYPYFIDFEPKKRELYEAVSETGEVLSGSMSNVSVGKAVTNTHSTEDYNIDMGGGGGFSLGWGLVAADWSGQEQTGTIKRDTRQTQSVRQTDFSTERRELQSHTTQLSQMYNLFQAFHLGTNRAVFLMEPRPHIRQIESTFINGPRALEGIQEVFLIVVRPKSMKDFCVGALLETAHITTKSVYEYDYATLTKHVEYDQHFDPLNPDNREYIEVVPVASGYVVDTSKGAGGISSAVIEQDDVESIKITVNPDQKAVTIKVVFEKPTSAGRIVLDLTIFTRSKNKREQAFVRRMFLTARELCCCPSRPAKVALAPSVTIDVNLSEYEWPVHIGPGSPLRFQESRHFAAVVRKEMVRSFTSPRRNEPGTVSYIESDAFHTRVIDVLRAYDPRTPLEGPVRDLPVQVGDETRTVIAALGAMTAAEVIEAETRTLARRLGLDEARVRAVKRALLRGASTEPPTGRVL